VRWCGLTLCKFNIRVLAIGCGRLRHRIDGAKNVRSRRPTSKVLFWVIDPASIWIGFGCELDDLLYAGGLSPTVAKRKKNEANHERIYAGLFGFYLVCIQVEFNRPITLQVSSYAGLGSSFFAANWTIPERIMTSDV